MSKRKFSALDESFEFPPVENWKTNQKKVLGCTYHILKPLRPVEPQPKQVEFVIEEKQENVWAFGKMTRFRIKGQFQCMTPAQGNTPMIDWAGIAEADSANVIVAPNFWEKLIEGIDLFHGNNKILTSNEVPYVSNFVNSFKYNFMDPDQKKLLCPSPAHPGYGIPSTKEATKGWDFDADSEWRTYAPNIFRGANKKFSFSYVPLDLAPFFQNSNYFENGTVQKIVPFPLLDRFLIRFRFNDNFNDNIFKITGITRLSKFDNIVQGSTTWKTTFQSVNFPQGIFVFAVKNTVISGLEEFKDFTGQMFEEHKIIKLSFDYDKEWFYTSEPNITNVGNDVMEEKLFYDYLDAAPFDLKLDKSKVTLKNIKDGFKGTPFPHVYINLTIPGDTSRLIPYLSEGNILQKNADLDLTFTFEVGGAPAGLAYIIYLYYTDNNLTLDTRQKNNPFFFSPYIKMV